MKGLQLKQIQIQSEVTHVLIGHVESLLGIHEILGENEERLLNHVLDLYKTLAPGSRKIKNRAMIVPQRSASATRPGRHLRRSKHQAGKCSTT